MKNKKSELFAGLLFAAMMTTGPVAWGDTFHDQSMVDINSFGWDSIGGAEDVQQIADDFRPMNDGSIKILNWTGKYHDDAHSTANKFEIRVFANSAGQPGEVIFSQSLPVAGSDTGGMDSGAHSLLSYTATVTDAPILKSGKKYWLSIREMDPSTSATWSWSFHNSDVAGGYSSRQGERGSWAVGTKDMAYSLHIRAPK